tara:strand:- start:722 stop:874 length:153 start_codon:yes stop_codon:yes gene_type:complete
MSGDNLHGKQPIKFYSEEVTLTKEILIRMHIEKKKNVLTKPWRTGSLLQG